MGTGTSPDTVTEHTAAVLQTAIPDVIHLPGLRGNPERTYPVTAVGPTYPGTFEKYSASLLSQWSEENDAVVSELNEDLRLLRLTGGVTATRANDVQIEIYVGRLPQIPRWCFKEAHQRSVADADMVVSQQTVDR